MTSTHPNQGHLADADAATPAAPAGIARDADECARLEAIIEAREREIATLHRISELGLREQPLEQILPAVVAEVSACTGFPIVAIEFYDAAQQVMTFAAATGMPLPPDPACLAVPVDQTLSGLVARSGEALIEIQAQDRPEYAAEVLRRLGVQTFVCVPMRVAGQVMGTLALAHPERAPTDELLLRLADSLANITAILVARKQAEQAVRDREQRMRTLLDHVPIGMFESTPAGHFHYVNPALAAILEYASPEELITVVNQTSISEALYAESARRPLLVDEVVQAPGHWRTYENRYRCKSGALIDTILSIAEHQDPITGRPALYGFVQNITERKRGEAALQVALTKYQTLFDSFPLGITVADATGQIVESNAMAERLLGIGRAEHSQRQIDGAAWRIVRPDGTPMLAEEYASVRALREQRVVENIEMGVIIPPGATTWINVTAAPLPVTGYGVVITYSDITERKRSEEALRNALEDLKRSNAELEQFAYVASHDLQEPLRAVTGMVQLLQQRYQGQLDARADQYIGLAVEAAARMQALINDLLTFSRVQRRAQPFAPTALETILTTALANLRVAIEESGAVITHDPLPSVQADGVQLTQLFQNLLGNAIKFRGEEPPHIHIGVERHEGAWHIAVRDNGIGIAPDYFERIFAIFQRLHPRRAYPGTGIGLAICKKIVEHHGGQIWVESRLGDGATFCFTIPDWSVP